MRRPITRLTIVLFVFTVVTNARLNALHAQDEFEQIKTTVESALPSDWKVAGAQENKSLWPSVDSLKDRYMGYVIQLVGPTFTKEVMPKGTTEKKIVTLSESAEFWLIPVWTGISRAQLAKDWSTADREIKGSMSMAAQVLPPDVKENVAYGWNARYLLVCKHDCQIVEPVAKKLKIRKR